MKRRDWLPWELNWLRKYGYATEKPDLEVYGEKPVEYITGWAEFRDQPIRVEERKTLIPRVETEELAELVCREILEKKSQKKLKIADIGTGSGAIALSIAQELLNKGRTDFEIQASDISSQALHIARENQKLWQIPAQNLIFRESNLLAAFHSDLKFDLIVANLPYIPTKRKNTLSESVIAFEPEIALFGGERGLNLINELLIQAPKHLKRQAPVWLEVDDSHQPEQVLSFLKRSINIPRGDIQIDVYPDLNNVKRLWRITF